MRWVPYIILVYVVTVVQTSVGGILTLHTSWLGAIRPDFLAAVALFAVLRARSGAEAVLAACVAGLAVDLTASGPVQAVGPMILSYAAAGGAIFRMREALFVDRALTQGVLAALFCVVAHGLWVTVVSLRSFGAVGWDGYVRMLTQAALLSAYTAGITPLVHLPLSKVAEWFVPTARGRSRRPAGGR